MNFTIDTIVYTPIMGQNVFRNEDTLGYCFINTGNCAIMLNNFLLQPNTSLKTFERDMVDKTLWKFQFQSFDTCSATNASLTCLIYSRK